MTQPPDRSSVGLYIHVPFCATLCGYCDFYRTRAEAGVQEGYEELLLAEAEAYASDPPVHVDTVYFGGGTPSLLEAERLGRLIGGLSRTFRLDPASEVTLEANPETVTFEALRAWEEAGVNRLSIGVQSLDARVLDLLGRRAGPEEAFGAVEMAVARGFEHLSADVMMGVPGQSAGSLLSDVSQLALLPLDHLSVYGLDLHEGTPLMERVARGELTLPDDDEAAEVYMAVHNRLREFGFEHYEVSNFARAGGRCAHNLRYWQGGDTIGLGPSAWTRFRGRLAGNVRDLAKWAAAVQRREPAFETVEDLSPARMKQDTLIFGLRVSDGVALDDVCEVLAQGGRDPESLVSSLASHGYAELEGDTLRLTPLGFLASNEVLAYLLPDFKPRETR
jgi:oxygen-independent coproporphyrinogen-3 oxidase